MTTAFAVCERSVADADPSYMAFEDDYDRLEQKAPSFCAAEAVEIVHDIRNTLNAVSMLSDLMLLQLPEDSPVRKLARDMKSACKDSNAMCERILASSRGDRKTNEQVDLSNLVTKFAPLVATCVPPASELRLDLAADLPPLDLAPSAVHQIVMNLVKNAAEALGDQPGVVTVSTSWVELDASELQEVQCGALRPGKYVCLAVSDTGCGIDEQMRDRMQTESFTTKNTGHGLGLASVRRIAAAHGANILLDSQVGVGTTIRVVFGDEAIDRHVPQRDVSIDRQAIEVEVSPRSRFAERRTDVRRFNTSSAGEQGRQRFRPRPAAIAPAAVTTLSRCGL